MTTSTETRRRRAPREPKPIKEAPFPVWSPVLVMLAVILTGVVLGREADSVPTAYFVIFAIAAIIMTCLVEVRGLFLTVAAIPLYFVGGTVIVGWLSTPNNTSAGKRTLIINAVYPAVAHFLWLLLPFAACVVIALVRWWLYREEVTRHAAYQDLLKRRREASERSNLDSYARVQAARSDRSRSPRATLGNSASDNARHDATASDRPRQGATASDIDQGPEETDRPARLLRREPLERRDLP